MLKYDEFIERVNEAGFWTPYTNYIDPEVFKFPWDGKNAKGQAYSGDPETDTEQWKTRAAQEKKLAYGFFFNGTPGGYIAPRFYSVFIDAFRPRMTMEERYESGRLGTYENGIWKLLNDYNRPLAWSDFRKKLGLEPAVKYKAEVRKLELALKHLHMTFDITVNGTEGHMGCDIVEKWVPPEWMGINPRMEHHEALEVIYRQAEKISSAGDAKKAFRKSLQLYKNFC